MGCCCGVVGLGIFGAIMAVLGAIFSPTMPLIINSIIDQSFVLKEGAITYQGWKEPPFPMYMRVYLFHIDNSDEVLKSNAKPRLVEFGPYTFTEKHIKDVKVHLDANNTIQYMQKRIYNFIPEMSNGTLNDNITTIHPVVVSAVNSIKDDGPLMKYGFNSFIKKAGSTLFITKTVNEFLFEGFSDPLINASKWDPSGKAPPFDKFGWFYDRNGTEYYDGLFNIYTGADDVKNVYKMDMWNLTQRNKFYKGHCADIIGTSGDGWPPYRERTKLTMYSSDLCRSIDLDYESDVEHAGITFYKYSGSRRLFANATEEPENSCYEVCGEPACNPSGVMDTSVCRYGSPSYISFPHYYRADDFYLDQVDGLEPADPERHEFTIIMEPRMAVPLKVSARFQINMLMEPVPEIDIVKDMKRTFIPILWFSVQVDLSDNVQIMSLLKLAVNSPAIASWSFFAVFCIGTITASVCGVIYYRRKRNRVDA